MVKVFGVREDGTLGICRAKPENRGRGTCYHGEHVSITEEQLRSGYLTKYNEKVWEERHGASLAEVRSRSRNHNVPRDVSGNRIASTDDGYILTREELVRDSNALASQFSADDWETLRRMTDTIMSRKAESAKQKFLGGVQEKLSSFLNSNDPEAVQTRKFLGEEINIDDFSGVVTHQVRAMTNPVKFSGRMSNLTRTVMTTLDNDMNKYRYTATVMFFGGRCCYCNVPLKNDSGRSSSPSAEHLTPVSPQSNGICGSTRFGNMALACIKCNSSRGNKELTEFVLETNRIPRESKASVLARIKAFRQFAMYEEYSPKQSEEISKEISRLNDKLKLYKSRASEDRRLLDDDYADLTQDLKNTIFNLRQMLSN